jgi:hypothetical protein
MKSTIYVICPDVNVSSGGVKKLHDHVNILNQLGFKAFIVYQTAGFRCTWFDHATPFTSLSQVRPGADDLIVVPEVYGPGIVRYFPGVRKVIFNQNAFNTCWGLDEGGGQLKDIYLHEDVAGVMVVSENDLNYFNYLFPGLPVWRVRNGIDPARFHDRQPKKKQIAFMPNKLPGVASHLLHVLSTKGIGRDFTFQSIFEVDFDTCAALLRESLIFLSLAHNEGFGLPVAEAMACGCLVIGYDGTGGRELLTRACGFPVAYNDITHFAQTIQAVIGRYRAGDESLTGLTRYASAYVREKYPPEAEMKDISHIYNTLFQPQTALSC